MTIAEEERLERIFSHYKARCIQRGDEFGTFIFSPSPEENDFERVSEVNHGNNLAKARLIWEEIKEESDPHMLCWVVCESQAFSEEAWKVLKGVADFISLSHVFCGSWRYANRFKEGYIERVREEAIRLMTELDPRPTDYMVAFLARFRFDLTEASLLCLLTCIEDDEEWWSV